MTRSLAYGYRHTPQKTRRIFWHRTEGVSHTMFDRYKVYVARDERGAWTVAVVHANNSGGKLYETRAETRAVAETAATRWILETARGRG